MSNESRPMVYRSKIWTLTPLQKQAIYAPMVFFELFKIPAFKEAVQRLCVDWIDERIDEAR